MPKKRIYKKLYKALSLHCFLMVIIIFFAADLSAQHKKNFVGSTIGSILFAHSWTVNYERMVFQKETAIVKKIYAKIGYGQRSESHIDWGQSWNLYNGSIVSLIGANHGFFELSTGVSYRQGSGSIDAAIPNNETKLSLSGACRFEYKNLMLRIGIGTQEIIFVGLGIGF